MGSELSYPRTQIKGLNLSSAKELFFLRVKVEGLSPKTAKNYEYVLRFFSNWLKENPEIQEIDHHRVREYLLSLQERKLNKVTLATHHRCLKVFFNFLVKEEFLKDSPIARIQAPRIPAQFPYVLDDQQVRSLLEAPKQATFEGLRNYIMLLTFLDTGIRLNELITLSLKDVSLGNRSLKVQGKGEKTREVYMGRKLIKYMHKWLQTRGYNPYEEALFISRKGEKLSPFYITPLISKLGKKAGIKGVRCSPHTLRHTFATNYVRNGGDPFSLQQLLGHSDIKTVMIYVHVAGVHLREAHAKYSPMDRMF